MLDELGKTPSNTKLRQALGQIASGMSLGPDGVLSEFYVKFWDVLGQDFTQMIEQAILTNKLPPGINTRMVVFLFKDGDLEFIQHWRHITLLNPAYKILAKAIHIRLQQVLPEMIYEGQSAFVPTRYILDTVLVQHELIAWA